MNENNQLQKHNSGGLKEKGQYVLAFGVIAAMLLVAQFPLFVVIFFGIFAYFLWKMFSMPSRHETREIFEFYLAANDVLRDDERRWFGFEMQEIIKRGENILKNVQGAPPLVYFTLGALYHKIGDHKSAENHLAYIVENEKSDESNYAYPSPELRNYVKMLRKIEREPAEAPLTSTALRALERARRNRGKALLEESRRILEEENRRIEAVTFEREKQRAEFAEKNKETVLLNSITNETAEKHSNGMDYHSETIYPVSFQNAGQSDAKETKEEKERKKEERRFANRKPISEVLHDIYDKNIQ